MNLPNWFLMVLTVLLVIILCVVLKINASVGSRGVSITQDLIK